jgi:Family of unknown function (DUF6152)
MAIAINRGQIMQRRDLAAFGLLATGTAWLPLRAWAHHGWSSFDQNRPIYLEGKASKVVWQNPHAELVLDVVPQSSVPADLKQRSLPAQSAPVDGVALLAQATLPTRQDRQWEIELAPLTRLQAWNMPEIESGTSLSVVGFTFAGERGDAILRAEFLFVGGKAYGLRSSPA